ncbi:sorbitol-6-phosphate 2-dehydrogenase [Enterococcus sp. AZ007]
MGMKSWLNLDNKVVIVTGGSAGIGKSIVKQLLENNAVVVNFDVKANNQIEHRNYFYCKVDVSNKAEVEKQVEHVWKEFNRIDGLVNNAGIALPGILVNSDGTRKYEITEESFERTVAVNQKGVFLVSQAVARKMIMRQSGVIVNMSTESAREGSIGQGTYVGTKGAINSMTCTWAKELGQFNIRVLGVAPGIIEETDLRSEKYEEVLALIRGISVDELRRRYIKVSNLPLGRVGKVSEVAEIVVFYLSEHASYLSGIVTNIAGGKSRG